MPEMTAILKAKRDSEHNEHKFLAAIQGIDLDESAGSEDAWENLKARVYSGGATSDANDILSLQGVNAQQAGFGIGAGLEYTDLKTDDQPKGPFG